MNKLNNKTAYTAPKTHIISAATPSFLAGSANQLSGETPKVTVDPPTMTEGDASKAASKGTSAWDDMSDI